MNVGPSSKHDSRHSSTVNVSPLRHIPFCARLGCLKDYRATPSPVVRLGASVNVKVGLPFRFFDRI